MKEAIIILGLIAFSSFPDQAKVKQNQRSMPDFSGTWDLERSQSKVTKENPIMSGGVVTLMITHREPEIRIIQRTHSNGKETTKEFVYYSDGRGETNPASSSYLSFHNGSANRGFHSPRTVASQSKWNKNKLRIRYSIIVQIPDGRRTKVEVEEEWEISADGRTLTQTTSFSSNDGNFMTLIVPGKLKKVFNKTS